MAYFKQLNKALSIIIIKSSQVANPHNAFCIAQRASSKAKRNAFCIIVLFSLLLLRLASVGLIVYKFVSQF